MTFPLAYHVSAVLPNYSVIYLRGEDFILRIDVAELVFALRRIALPCLVGPGRIKALIALFGLFVPTQVDLLRIIVLFWKDLICFVVFYKLESKFSCSF